MFRYLTALICGGLALASLRATETPAASAEPPAIDSFLAPHKFRLPKLSPDGQSYAIVLNQDDVDVLMTVNLATGKATPIANLGKMKLTNFWWKGSDLLLLLVRRGWQQGFQTFNLQTNRAENLDQFSLNNGEVLNSLPADPDHILIQSTTSTGSGVELRRLNVRTKKSTALKAETASIHRWFSDQQGRPLAGLGRFHERWFMNLAPAQEGGTWRKVSLGEKSLPDFYPFAIAPDQKRILGWDHSSGDVITVAAWNPADDTKETVWRSDAVDPLILFNWGEDWTRVRSIVYEDDRRRVNYLAPEDRALMKQVDAALDQTENLVVSATQDDSKMILQARSDRVALDYYLFDRSTRRLAKLGSGYPNIQPERQAPGRYFTLRSRDGLLLHGRIHLPLGATGPQPAVLYVLSLNERAAFAHDAFIQLLASRGYAVVQVDHRGVRGYGQKFAAAGDLQIGGAMADDLIDAIRSLAHDGLIDPKRIAIFGSENAGLLAAQTLARYPEHFAAWVNFSTPMDMRDLDYHLAVFGRYTKDETKTLVGGESGGAKYLRSLDPIAVLPKVRSPSFHYYKQMVHNRLVNNGDLLKKHLGKLPQPAVLVVGDPVTDVSDYVDNHAALERTELKRVYAELLKFLELNLGAKK